MDFMKFEYEVPLQSFADFVTMRILSTACWFRKRDCDIEKSISKTDDSNKNIILTPTKLSYLILYNL